MRVEFDLFGKMVIDREGAPGRPEHVPTEENVRKIRVLVLARWKVADIAREIGVSAPTLRRYYFRDLEKARDEVNRIFEARALMALQDKVDAGDVGAIKTMLHYVAASKLRDVPAAVKVPAKALGKKEVRRLKAGAPRGGWSELLPAPVPAAMN